MKVKKLFGINVFVETKPSVSNNSQCIEINDLTISLFAKMIKPSDSKLDLGFL